MGKAELEVDRRVPDLCAFLTKDVAQTSMSTGGLDSVYERLLGLALNEQIVMGLSREFASNRGPDLSLRGFAAGSFGSHRREEQPERLLAGGAELGQHVRVVAPADSVGRHLPGPVVQPLHFGVAER